MREKEIQRIILNWYSKNKRDLPWRKTHDPYKILVSEVMLQQTQVERVIPKYGEFLKAIPTVKKLASAKPSEVIKKWKGLGYNRRALFLHGSAKSVVQDFGGIFPETLEELKTLPGVGEYTARAILSFAFQKPVVMLDTNNRKFYQRIFFGHEQVSDKELLAKAEEVFPKRKAYEWNQALMDFGSLALCNKNRRCLYEPVRRVCKACNAKKKYRNREIMKQKSKKKVRFRDTDRYYRGRIIDLLREKESIRVKSLVNRFDDIPKEKVEKIIDGLEKDRLILRMKRSILLP